MAFTRFFFHQKTLLVVYLGTIFPCSLHFEKKYCRGLAYLRLLLYSGPQSIVVFLPAAISL